LDQNGTSLKEEMVSKFLRHRKILMANCEQVSPLCTMFFVVDDKLEWQSFGRV
jgi:hypothetical protein